jgi:hypothetical protein
MRDIDFLPERGCRIRELGKKHVYPELGIVPGAALAILEHATVERRD